MDANSRGVGASARHPAVTVTPRGSDRRTPRPPTYDAWIRPDSSTSRRRRLTATTWLLSVVVLVAACTSTDSPAPSTADPPRFDTATLVAAAASPAAVIAEADGSVLYAERLTGAVRRVDPDGVLIDQPVATVATRATDSDQRGLLGLQRDQTGRLFAAWTRADDGRLVVGELDADRAPRLIWEGPTSADLANGGHLGLLPGGELLIGIGDLLQPAELADDVDLPNRKLLALDPDGLANQTPRIVSSGWNNPFGFVVAPDGTIWVADNTGGDGPERIGRGDRPAAEATPLDPNGDAGPLAPSALVALDDGTLGLCSFLRNELLEVDVARDVPALTGTVLASGCATGAARLPDGRIVMSGTDALLLSG